LPCKAGKITGYGLLRPRKSHLCKIPDAPSIAQSHQFYLLSPEAVRLTLWGQNHHFSKKRTTKKQNEKKRNGQSGCAAGSFALCSGSDHPDLIFGYFGSSQSDKASAAIERGKVRA
jgi:hypothetical protein